MNLWTIFAAISLFGILLASGLDEIRNKVNKVQETLDELKDELKKKKRFDEI